MEGDELKDPEKLPPGFRFHPSDEELIAYYLVNKISDSTFTARAIGDVDLNKCEPWDLPGKAKMGEKEWYFFCLRDRKYPTGVRTNRATNTGYWKTTGKDKEIFNSTTSEMIGMKKTLVFYRGRAPRGEKTNWVMHEYRIHSKSAYRSAKDEWVVCRVFQKSGIKKYHTTTSATAQASRSINMGMNSINMGPPLIPIDSVQFPNLVGSRNNNYMPFGGPPHMNYPVGGGGGGCFGLNLNLGSSGGGVGSSAGPQQPMFRAPQQDINSVMMGGSTSTLGMDQNGFGVVDVSATTRYANNVDNCMEFDPYWPHYN